MTNRFGGRKAASFLLQALGSIVVALAALPVSAKESGWQAVPAILLEIKPPTFPDRDFDITEFGAEQGAKADCKPAIDRAVAACAAAGGGRVVVPPGTWVVKGPVHLKSGVNLHVSRDSVLRFSANPEDYLPTVFTRFEGTEVMNYSPLIYAFEQDNIAVTGEGTLDGQANAEHWWPWKRTGGDDIAALCRLADDGLAPRQRQFGKGHQLRPSFIEPYGCRNVLIEGVTIINAPMWVIHPCLCENVTVRGVTVDSHGPNNDGCNPESCRNVLIEKCTFDTGDDCIAVKSGRNADGRRLARPSENIVIRDCIMKDGHGGVTLGSEMSGGIRNVFVEDCYMSSPELERAIRLKSNSMRGGFLENLYARNIRVGEVREAVLHIDLRYTQETGEHPPTIRNIVLDNVSCEKSERSLYLLGIRERPMQNVLIMNSTFENAEKPSVVEFVEELTYKNVTQPEE